jgi:hypothetical protein
VEDVEGGVELSQPAQVDVLTSELETEFDSAVNSLSTANRLERAQT